MYMLLDAAAGAATDPAAVQGGGIGFTVMYAIIMIVVFYFLLIRPQKKEQKKIAAMVAAMEIGDVVLTTSGFYGVIIDITEEDVIVEFGSNKNCRIPMRKTAIAQVEKPE